MKAEDQVRIWLVENDVIHEDNTASTTKSDFTILLGTLFFGLEVKEKGRKYNLSNWPNPGVGELDVFIQDELSFRRLINDHGTKGCILIKDNPGDRWVLLDGATLVLMPKVQVNRDQGGYMKGKLMMDVTHGYVAGDFDKVMWAVMAYAKASDKVARQSECWAPNRTVETGGVVRTNAHKSFDVSTYLSEGS